jgi:predicted PurR-regulated permease PerM
MPVAVVRASGRAQAGALVRLRGRCEIAAVPRERRIRARLRRREAGDGEPQGEPEYVEIEPGELSGVFAAPRWLRDLGIMAWLVVGVAAALAGGVWLLTLTQTIVIPVVTAGILAAVLSPVVGYLERRGVPRLVGTGLVFVAVIVVGAAVVVLIMAGVAKEAGSLTSNLKDAADKIQNWLQDLGIDKETAQNANDSTSTSSSDAFHALLDGVGTGIKALTSLVVFLSFMLLSLIFLLKDGPMIRSWGERHLGLPVAVAHTITGRVLTSLRGYFVGVTVVAAFNAVVIGLGALLLGVPLAGSIAVVNFFAAYIPYLGAWSAGAFTVLIALGAEGPETALAMAVIALLANGALQQVIQPIAYGAALGIHPLAVLIVTIAAGSLFGTIGLVLAAPLTAAGVRIASDLSRARAQAEAQAAEAPAAEAPA